MLPQINTAEEFAAVSQEVRGLVPVSFAAFLSGICDKCLRDRIERGTLRAWSVGGGLFVSVGECQRRGPGRRKTLPTGHLFFSERVPILPQRLA